MDSKQHLKTETSHFQRDGYLIVPGLASAETCQKILTEIEDALEPSLRGPAEFEVDVCYPGAPKDRFAKGANTPRRLLHAYARHSVFREWAANKIIKDYLQSLMQKQNIMLSQSHHNCIMTKYPGFSSMTSWHQDFRYWSYDTASLVSVWLALGIENRENGSLSVIPGTHKKHFKRGQLDRDLFLRDDLTENQTLIDQAINLELKAGDVVFFHSQLFHAAGENQSENIKKALVFTYHDADNKPIPATKSATYPSIKI